MPFKGLSHVGSRNHVLDGVPKPPTKGDWGKCASPLWCTYTWWMRLPGACKGWQNSDVASCFYFFLIFFVSVPCARFSWPSRQFLSARKSTVSYCQVTLDTVFRSILRQSQPNKANVKFKCSSVHPYICLSTKSVFDFHEIWHLGRRWWVMHDGIMIQSKVKVKVTSSSQLKIRPFSRAISSAIYNGSWQLTTDS